MLAFIDESGCPGFKITRGSDPIFALGMVVFDSAEAALQVNTAIRGLHSSIPHRGEFKFSKTSEDVRDQFFQGVAALPFRACAIVVRKEAIYSQMLRTDHDKFYNYFLRLLMGERPYLRGAKVRLDGSGGRDFERALKSYLRKQLSVGAIEDFRLVDSKRDQLAQLADMCVGAIARKYRENRKDRDRWFAIIEPRITNVWPFG